jgi:hypothetical protein
MQKVSPHTHTHTHTHQNPYIEEEHTTQWPKEKL